MKCINLFTRYPEPGKAKTRLIPQIGAKQAAALQRGMTGHTVLRARLWAAEENAAEIVVRYTGAPKSAFRKWLGPDLVYFPQGEGDLGERMQRAVEEGFQAGATKVVLLGCDCPDASPDFLSAAFHALDDHDIVIGPAHDGGYYLIGMKRPHAELFRGPEWGTDSVYARTQQIIRSHDWSYKELDRLHDVDEAESLPLWERHVRPNKPGSISVVIPALNEAAHIEACIQSARAGADEVIVVDGGSTDDTRERAHAAGARVMNAPKGRAVQLNLGAYHAKGEYLLFLHADSRLPTGFADAVRRALQSPGTHAGAFSLHIDALGVGYRAIEWGVRQRSRWFDLPYGDQALFVLRETFMRTGGFAQIPIMEDVDWVRRAKMNTRLAIRKEAITVSSRRWHRLGLLRTTLLNQGILLSAALGISYGRLANWYRR